MILQPNDPRFGITGNTFVSPYPDEGSLSDPRFIAQLKQVGSEGLLSRYQAEAWDGAQRVLMRKSWTSPFAGGIRSDWLPKVAAVAKVTATGAEVVHGLFAKPPFPVSADSKKLGTAAAQVGLVAAQAVLTGVPIVGNILKAAVGIGTFIWKLANRGKEERELTVPWQEFSRATDADTVNAVLGEYMAGTDWTPFFMPSVAWEDSQGFSLETTEQGDNTRAFGVFSPDGEPLYAGGLGMMPGTEQIADIIQVAQVWSGAGGKRRDVVTNVGAYLPSVSQFAVGAWQSASRAGNPDMYKVRAGDLADAWTSFFDRLFADAFDRYAGLGVNDFGQRVFWSKALAPYVVVAQGKFNQLGLNVADLDGPYITPDIFSNDFVPFAEGTRYERPDIFYIEPACRKVKQRQKAMLSRSLVCALVRPREVGILPAFAAFKDKSAALSPGYANFGEELRDYCDEMRALLLKHPERYKLAQIKPGAGFMERYAPDVLDVDPPFAAKLEESFTSAALPLKVKEKLGLAWEPLEPNAPPAGPEQTPGGGSPFPIVEEAGWWATYWPLVLTLGTAAAGAGYGVYTETR